MPAPPERQTAFVGGEFAPGLWGRADLEKYSSGCKTALNLFVSPFGSLVSRPGTQHVAEILNRSDVDYETPYGRLVPFIFSDTDTLILAFLNDEIQFFSYNTATGRAEQITDEDGPIFLTTNWSEGTLADLRFTQSGDVVVIVEPNSDPYLLKRLSSDNKEWSLVQAPFDADEFPTFGGEPMLFYPPYALDESLGIFPAFQPLFESDAAAPWQWAITRVVQDADGNVSETEPFVLEKRFTPIIVEWMTTITYYPTSESAQDWEHYTYVWPRQYLYIALRRSGPLTAAGGPIFPEEGGNIYWDESAPGLVLLGSENEMPERIEVSADHPVRIQWEWWPWKDYTDPDGEKTIIATRVYRGQEGNFGFVGQTTDRYFIDNGEPPDFSDRPPQGENPFADLSSGDKPACAAHYEGRRFYGASTRIHGSAVHEYANFDDIKPPTDADALAFPVESNRYERVRAIVPWQGLIVLTDSSEMLVGGSGQSEIITPSSIAVRPLSRFGSSSLQPLEVNDSILFVQRKGTVPRAMALGGGGYQVSDISILSRHLFTGYGIASWCFAEDPWSLIWVVRSDGTVLSCTFHREQQLVAWTRHAIAGGTVLEVCSIPEGYEDGVYFLVRRGSSIHLERLATRVVEDVRDAICLDSSVTYDGRQEIPYSSSDTGYARVSVTAVGGNYDINYPCEVYVEAETTPGENVGKVLRVYGDAAEDEDDSDDVVLVRLDTHTGGSTYDGFLLSPLPTEMDGEFYDEWSITTRYVSGLDHLDGEEVYALVDGYVVGPLEVSGGQVEVGTEYEPADVATVGLEYNYDFESLDSPGNRLSKKVVANVAIELYGRGGYVGESLSNLHEIQFRQVDHAWGPIPLTRGEFETAITGAYGYGGSVAFRHSILPVEILSITRELEVGR
jgi:hypothetical protein